MNLFYTSDIMGSFALLRDEEARHCAQVLRMKPGDLLYFVDGKGFFYEGIISEIGKRECAIRILKREEEAHKPYRVHVAIAPTKNIDRFEWFLEKATEIGIDEITPLLCEHSERKQIRLDRLEKILIAAVKQSLKATLPKLNDLTPLETLINQCTEGQRFIAYLGADANPHLKDACLPGQKTTILIGPEGDFAPKEIQQALAKGFRGVSLGGSRLRTETAGVAACHIVTLLNE